MSKEDSDRIFAQVHELEKKYKNDLTLAHDDPLYKKLIFDEREALTIETARKIAKIFPGQTIFTKYGARHDFLRHSENNKDIKFERINIPAVRSSSKAQMTKIQTKDEFKKFFDSELRSLLFEVEDLDEKVKKIYETKGRSLSQDDFENIKKWAEFLKKDSDRIQTKIDQLDPKLKEHLKEQIAFVQNENELRIKDLEKSITLINDRYSKRIKPWFEMNQGDWTADLVDYEKILASKVIDAEREFIISQETDLLLAVEETFGSMQATMWEHLATPELKETALKLLDPATVGTSEFSKTKFEEMIKASPSLQKAGEEWLKKHSRIDLQNDSIAIVLSGRPMTNSLVKICR
jgi:hypothetical protein